MTTSSRLTLRQSVALVWRTLRSMRTALILLLMMALAAVAGSLIPQIPNSPDRVAQYLTDHPLLGEFYRRAGLFDVFGSWWFVLITTLLFVSLGACLFPRTRALVRALRQRPVQAREIDGFRHYEERTVGADPEVAIASSQRVLRRRRFRVARDGTRAALAAEKGMLREGGSLLFHWAFILVLAGVIIGKGTGYTGYVVLSEGETWTEAQANYDQLHTGRFFGGGFTGLGLHLVDYRDRFTETGQPMDFVSTVDVTGADGTPLGRHEIRVNHPLMVSGLRIFQYGFGWAPHVQVRRGGELLADRTLEFERDPVPSGVSELAVPWRGVVKLTAPDPDVEIDLELWPDSDAFFESLRTGRPMPMIRVFAPLIRYTVYRGRLVDVRDNALDTTFMRRASRGVAFGGQTIDLATGEVASPGAAGLSLTFSDLKRYTVLQVSRDVGVPIVFVAAILILLGLLPALYTSRRKVWVRAEPNGAGTVLRVGGFALQRRGQFEEEFSRLVDELAREGEVPSR